MATHHPPRSRARRRIRKLTARDPRTDASSSDAHPGTVRPSPDAHADDGSADESEAVVAETALSRADAETLQRYLRGVDAVPVLTREEEVAVAAIMATGTQRVRELLLPLPVTVQYVLAAMKDAPSDAARKLFEVEEGVPTEAIARRLERVAARVPLLRRLAQQCRAPAQTTRGTRSLPHRDDRHRIAMALADLGLADHVFVAVVAHLRQRSESLGVYTARVVHPHRQRVLEEELGMTAEEVTTVLNTIARAQHEAATARHCLIEANMRVVPRLARRYLGRGLELVDLIQEGNIGLTRAVDKFDGRRGYLLATYASWWIKSAILRALEKAQMVPQPRRLLELKPTVARATALLVRELGREPTPREIAQYLQLPLETVDEVLHATGHMVSLATPIGETEALTLGDLLADPHTPSPAAVVEARESFALANQTVTTLLTPAEARALRHRLGLPPATASDENAATPDPAARGRLSRGATQALRTLRATLQPDVSDDVRRHKK